MNSEEQSDLGPHIFNVAFQSTSVNEQADKCHE